MSLRPRDNGPLASPKNMAVNSPANQSVTQPTIGMNMLQKEQANIAKATRFMDVNANLLGSNQDPVKSLTMDDLNPVEQAAATLGVDPDGIKPIAWLNEAHYKELQESNALDTTLGRRIAAYKHLSENTAQAGAA